MHIESRLPEIGTTIFTVMSKMAAEHNAINLSQGFPDFSIDQEIIELVYQNMREGHNQYAPMPGASPLRNAIAQIIHQSYGHTVDPETEVTVSAGATEALFAAIAAFIRSGDEVIVFDPAYDSYNPAIRLNGGIPIHIPLTFPSFSIDWALVEQKISARTKMIIINTPHNPSGTTLAQHDLLTLEQLAERHNLLVLSDEVYDRLVYDLARHESVLRYPALAKRSIAVFSFGKTFHATGWKCGFAIAPPLLTTEIRKTHQYIVFSVNTPVQLALATYLQKSATLDALPQFYQQKRDFFLNELTGSSFEPLPCAGSYFLNLSYKNISQEPDVMMATKLTKAFKVASIPLSVFYQDKTDHQVLRFCFAKKEETLLKAARILRGI
jgi:methionine aminotransferase